MGKGALKMSAVGSTADWTVSPDDQARWCLVGQGQGKGGKGEVPQRGPALAPLKLTLGPWAKLFLCLGLGFPNWTWTGLGQLSLKSPCNQQ